MDEQVLGSAHAHVVGYACKRPFWQVAQEQVGCFERRPTASVPLGNGNVHGDRQGVQAPPKSRGNIGVAGYADVGGVHL